ncbi:hypothetical protein Cfor_07981 [Coptotermes formosanus]|jgi:hypothetical protein|uniref:Mos1 transposase HTH domain-containing protein n=1 Tax=Coptotermes formosanus TaxID=36987 RepID=A0A6L2PEV0_COPFO|nr:hypothetical protein Cfor_07981 [Coptotermes formosanus]
MAQSANVKFYFRCGKTATERYKVLKTIYIHEDVLYVPIFRWFKRVRLQREDLEDDLGIGQPSAV